MAVNEGWVLDGLNTNDETNFALEELTFTPAKKQAQWIDNPDVDGAALAYEPNYTNGEFLAKIRIVPQATMDTALAKWGELQAKLQKASLMREQGGIPVVWTPAGSTRSYTGYALLGEISELPITPIGDLAGWFINAPVITVRLVCRPFLYKASRTLLAGTSAEVPLQVAELLGVGGDVPAEGELIVTEKAAVDRRHLEWGIDKSTGSLLITAASMVTAGFTGVVTTRSGAYSAEKVVRGTAVSAWSPLCSTGNIANIGTFRVKPRVFVTSAAARYRISYRVGDGPFRSLDPVIPPVINQFAELDVGEVTLEEVERGTQRSEIRIEILSAEAVTEVDVNYLQLIPSTAGYGKARGLQSNEATQLLGYDEFTKATAGNLDAPKALELGGNWAEAGKTGASGLVVDAANHVAQRSTPSDAGLDAGCYAIAGSINYTACLVKASITPSIMRSGGGLEQGRFGVLARYSSTEKWLMAVLMFGEPGHHVSGVYLVAVKRTGAGAGTVLKSQRITSDLHSAGVQIELLVAADGTWSATASGGFTPVSISGQDVDLASGGTLASGKPGLYDAWTSSASNTRLYDNFNCFASQEAGRVCFASKKAEVRWDETERQDATGTYSGRPSSYRGDRFFVPVGNSRLAVKMRRNDVDAEPDAAVTDKQEVEVKIAERFLAPQ